MPARTDDDVRCEAYEACRVARARGGAGALQELVAAAWVEKAHLQQQVERLEHIAGLDRDTIPCGAPEEGGP